MSIPEDVFETQHAFSYEELRPHIQNGDILLCCGNDWFSRLIKRVTRSHWSHVGFIFRLDAIDRVMVLESVDGAGVRTQALSILVAGNGKHIRPYGGRLAIARHTEFARAATFEKLRRMSQFAVDRFGCAYNWGEVFMIALRIIIGSWGIKLPPLKPGGAFICSEYAAACYESVGVKIAPNKLGFITPADFAADPKVNLVAVLRIPTAAEVRRAARRRAQIERAAVRDEQRRKKAA